MIIPLSHISPGTSARIEFIGNEELMAGRLRDLGFVPGAVVSCVLQKAKRNIAAYLVRGAVIALREEDSRLMFVRPCEVGLGDPVCEESATGSLVIGAVTESSESPKICTAAISYEETKHDEVAP